MYHDDHSVTFLSYNYATCFSFNSLSDPESESPGSVDIPRCSLFLVMDIVRGDLFDQDQLGNYYRDFIWYIEALRTMNDGLDLWRILTDLTVDRKDI